ncbi:MAG: hypothetical protein CMK59_09490 [Proteobacteria bacterium]|nr:hypothetical protein [Pseudomonadota bacterium]
MNDLITIQSASDLAKRLSISKEAVLLCRDSDFIDLHIDTFIPARLWGYNPLKKNKNWILGRHFFSHLDLHRMKDGGISGAMWSITTNPFRSAKARWSVYQQNEKRFFNMVNSQKDMTLVKNTTEYMEAKKAGIHACFLSVQGGNAFEAAPCGPLSLKHSNLIRITLVHLTNSIYGATSSPGHHFRRQKNLSVQGKKLIEQMNEGRIFVDLAHAHPQTFWDAVDVHDSKQPLLATHTGVCGATPHWRNLDDNQLKAIAQTGGVIGIIFAENFLKKKGGPKEEELIMEHLNHAIGVVGEDHVGIGSDLDGAISPPTSLCSGEHYPRLIQKMLNQNWSEQRIKKILGLNFLRAFNELKS